MKALYLILSLVLGNTFSAQAEDYVTKDQQLALIARAKVWFETDTENKDMLAGAARPEAYAFKAVVKCSYVNEKIGGFTEKFMCFDKERQKVIKVKYSQSNKEAYGEIIGSRLLWALGFGRDDNYPAIVHCEGCPSEVTKHGTKSATENNVYVFEPATIEVRNHRNQIETANDSGWRWDKDLFRIKPELGGATRAEIDAFRLIGSFMNHWDQKPDNQRIVCLDQEVTDLAQCKVPFLMIHDHGATFGGKGGMFDTTGNRKKVEFKGWREMPVWKNKGRCEISIDSEDKVITEAGRALLAKQMSKLSQQQILDLFVAARVELQNDEIKDSGKKRRVTADDWAQVFIAKRAEITEHSCPR